ncbi:MAG: hypothetical protein ACYDHW_06660 [Syntrophorhabdaceae bacterium]
MSEALAAQSTVVQIKAEVQLIQQVLADIMIKDVHYGTIPGTPKPTLYKPGSEKILRTFHIGVDPSGNVQDLSTNDEIRYRVFARAFNQITGDTLGVGVGECSSSEEKYKWRRPVCDEEFNETPEDRKRLVWKRGKEKNYQQKQVRTNPSDVANTILKMAKKRAQIDMTLTVTAASDVFEQDLEDLPDEIREGMTDQRGNGNKPPMQPPKEKKDPKKSGTEKDLKTEITRMINEMIDETLREDYIQDKTGFEGVNKTTGEKKWVDGKRSLDDVTDAAMPVVYGKVKKDYELFVKATKGENA